MRSLLFLMILSLPVAAQYQNGYAPNPNPLNYLPNYYNRANQPLSPYLNLLRGNPAVNYYYGARPGLPTGGVNVFGQAPPYQPFVGVMGGGFLPQSRLQNDGTTPAYEPGGKPITLPSASHPIIFGNTFANHGGFASVYASAMSRAGMPPSGQQRSSAQGVGSSPPKR
jgi:hypothetical protein